MTDDALAKALEEMTAAIASILDGDPGPMINSWAASDDITLFGAGGPIEKGHKPDFPPPDQRITPVPGLVPQDV
jgi:hypothetical protein